MHEVLVTIKSVYGNATVYPACEKARVFAAIAGTQTLTKPVLANIKALGYKVVNTTPAIEV